MYGKPWDRLKIRYDELKIEDLKMIPMSPETASVEVSSELRHG